jgi:hypothetical protein
MIVSNSLSLQDSLIIVFLEVNLIPATIYLQTSLRLTIVHGHILILWLTCCCTPTWCCCLIQYWLHMEELSLPLLGLSLVLTEEYRFHEPWKLIRLLARHVHWTVLFSSECNIRRSAEHHYSHVIVPAHNRLLITLDTCDAARCVSTGIALLMKWSRWWRLSIVARTV